MNAIQKRTRRNQKEMKEARTMGCEDRDTPITSAPVVETSAPVVETSAPVTKYANDILLEKLDGCGIDKLVLILKEQFNMRITNIKSSSISLDKRKQKIITCILKCIVKRDDDIADKILSSYFEIKPKEKKNTDWINEFDVGEDVLYKGSGSPYIKSMILKKNQSSLTVVLYLYKRISDDNAVINQTYGTDRLVWIAPYGQKKIIRSRDTIIKHGEGPYYDMLFLEGKKNVDYGW